MKQSVFILCASHESEGTNEPIFAFTNREEAESSQRLAFSFWATQKTNIIETPLMDFPDGLEFCRDATDEIAKFLEEMTSSNQNVGLPVFLLYTFYIKWLLLGEREPVKAVCAGEDLFFEILSRMIPMKEIDYYDNCLGITFNGQAIGDLILRWDYFDGQIKKELDQILTTNKQTLENSLQLPNSRI